MLSPRVPWGVDFSLPMTLELRLAPDVLEALWRELRVPTVDWIKRWPESVEALVGQRIACCVAQHVRMH